MTSPELLKRNLKILAMYDSGDYSRKRIVLELNLSSVSVVHEVIRCRYLYEQDSRASRFTAFHVEPKTPKNSHIPNLQPFR